MTPDQFRRLALGLPGVEEAAHMSHPDFRVGGKIFATLGHPRSGWGMVAVTPEQQSKYVAEHPGVFTRVKGAWGRAGCTYVELEVAKTPIVRQALRDAWRKRAPEGLLDTDAD